MRITIEFDIDSMPVDLKESTKIFVESQGGIGFYLTINDEVDWL